MSGKYSLDTKMLKENDVTSSIRQMHRVWQNHHILKLKEAVKAHSGLQYASSVFDSDKLAVEIINQANSIASKVVHAGERFTSFVVVDREALGTNRKKRNRSWKIKRTIALVLDKKERRLYYLGSSTWEAHVTLDPDLFKDPKKLAQFLDNIEENSPLTSAKNVRHRKYLQEFSEINRAIKDFLSQLKKKTIHTVSVAYRISNPAASAPELVIVNSKEAVDELAHEVFAIANRSLKKNLKKFITHLDPEAVTTMRRVGLQSTEFYNVLCEPDDPETRLRRNYAARTYRVLVPTMIDHGTTFTNDEVFEIIDRGGKLSHELASLLTERLGIEIKPSTIRNLSHYPYNGCERDFARMILAHAPELQAIPVSKWPSAKRCISKKDFRRIYGSRLSFDYDIKSKKGESNRSDYMSETYLYSYFEFRKNVEAITGHSKLDALKQMGGDWRRLHNLVSRCDSTSLKDYCRRIGQHLIIPAVYQIGIRKESYLHEMPVELGSHSLICTLLGQQSIRQILDGNQRWHTGGHMANFNNQIAAIGISSWKGNPKNISWPVIFNADVIDQETGVSFHPISSKLELEIEGTAMNHCVGGYVSQCLGDSHIFSVLDEHGNRLSTLQLRSLHYEGGTRVVLQQNQSQGSSEPSKLVQEAAARLVDRLNKDEDGIDWLGISAAKARINIPNEDRLSSLDFDPSDINATESIYQVWRPFLPKPLRYSSYPEFLAGTRLKQAIRQKLLPS